MLGASAVATVGLTETLLFLLYAIGIGLAMAVTAVVARRIGEGKPEEAAVTAVQAIWIALLASLPFAIIGIVFAQDLRRLMGADAWTLEHGYPYIQWALGSNVVIMLLLTINAVFRGAGDAAAAMRVLWLANALNIVLDPILIFGIGPVQAVDGVSVPARIDRTEDGPLADDFSVAGHRRVIGARQPGARASSRRPAAGTSRI